MKRGAGKNKGNKFERDTCRALSQWWTGGKSDDIFWRSASSGGRATQRRRKGKNTHGSHGDVAALDPIGEPLLDLLVVELKRGYNRFTLFDCLDRPEHGAQTTWDEWIQQAVESAEFVATFAWVIIARRDKRETIIVMPAKLFKALSKYEQPEHVGPGLKMLLPIRFKHVGKRVGYTDRMMLLVAFLFEDFLTVQPETIKRLSRIL